MQCMHANTIFDAAILIHFGKTLFKTFSLRCYAALLMQWRRCCANVVTSNAMNLIPHIVDCIANGNARYKRNEFDWNFDASKTLLVDQIRPGPENLVTYTHVPLWSIRTIWVYNFYHIVWKIRFELTTLAWSLCRHGLGLWTGVGVGREP